MASAALLLDAPSAFLQGWLTMAGLIVAIGAQNALVLREGAGARHVLPVVLVCIVSDWLLVALGVFGLGAAAGRVAGLAGGVPLRRRGLPRRVRRPRRAGARGAARPPACSWQAAAARSARRSARRSRMTYLNPHVYLDTVVLLGGVGAQQRRRGARLRAGAWAASAMWFAHAGLRRSRRWRAGCAARSLARHRRQRGGW